METLNPPVIKVKKDERGRLCLDAEGVEDYTGYTAINTLNRLPRGLKYTQEVALTTGRDVGICAILRRTTTHPHSWLELEKVLFYCFSTWEHYSGDIFYPVPDPLSVLGSEEAYNKLAHWEGDYGYYRAKLFIHCLHMLVRFVDLRDFYGIKD